MGRLLDDENGGPLTKIQPRTLLHQEQEFFIVEAGESAVAYAPSRPSRFRRQDGRRNVFRHETTQAESSHLPYFKNCVGPYPPLPLHSQTRLMPRIWWGAVGGETGAKMRMRV